MNDTPAQGERLLDIRDLAVEFRVPGGAVPAVKGVSLHLDRGETLALVGESGSGKSVTALSVLQLLPYPSARHPKGSIRYRGQELLGAPEKVLREVRGNKIAMVFQEPMTSLNPLHTIEKQVGEVLSVHKGMGKAQARARVLELLRLVGLPNPEQRLNAYPHELSGGQRQRVMIAMALANEPDILIADEPTTALDVTIQAQILDLLQTLRRETGMALVLITHDLGVVAEGADRVLVQYAGRPVETQPASTLFKQPHHPYTAALLAALPERARQGERLTAIEGLVPGQFDRPTGCLFAPRCPYVQTLCHAKAPPPASDALGRALCHFPLVDGQPLPLLPEASAA
jgi:oligopeptide/dipeptide ABC transporter ATP-binding protein